MSISDDIDYIKNIIKQANLILEECVDSGSDWKDERDYAGSLLKKAFNAALSLCAKYSLTTDTQSIRSTLAEAEMNDLTKVDEYDGTGVYYLYWGARLLSHLDIIQKLYGRDVTSEFPATLDLIIRIIRQAEYAMEGLDKYPENETELDGLMENLFKPIYPDLLPTPVVTKPIKNFQPDTGIPSLQLLIEYKYVASKEDVKRIVDEVLADTLGYKSKDWVYFFFVIYERRRFMPEATWNTLLQQCGTARNTWIFVIHGIPTEQTE
jgi:hypothetical protein